MAVGPETLPLQQLPDTGEAPPCGEKLAAAAECRSVSENSDEVGRVGASLRDSYKPP
jgi:hypothetical protein